MNKLYLTFNDIEDEEILKKFIYEEIPEELKNNFVLLYDTNKTINLERYLKENLNISYSIYDIVMFALNHLYITKDGNNVIVTFDQNVTLYNSYTKVIDILNLLEYGSLEIKAYPILSEIFKLFNQNAINIYNNYI